MALNPRSSRNGSASTGYEPGGIFQGKITLVYEGGTVRVFVRTLGINVGPCRIVGKQHDEEFVVNDEVLVAYLDNQKSEMVVIGRLTDRPGVEAATTEPIGHEDKTESVISFNNSTRVFTIAPVGDSFNVWCVGKRYTKTAAESITLPDTTGLYYIYYSSTGVLSSKTSFFTWDQDAPTAYIYYNSATAEAEFFADERHGVTLDWATHEYLHRTRGASLAEGLGASGYTLAGTGSSNADMQISIENGTFFDEDLEVNITHSATPTANTWEQRLQSTAYIPMFYRFGSSGSWRLDTATAYPVKYGSARATYNLSSGGTWSTPDMTSGKFGVTWIVATNNLNEPVIGILGQTVSDNIGQAEDVSYADLDLTGLPIVEIRPLYKLIYETNTGYTNAVKSRLARIADIRANQAINIGIGASALSSLTDVGLTTTVANDILAYNGSNWTNTNTPTFQSATIVGGVTVDTSTFSVDAMNNRVGVLTTSPNEALDVRGNIALTGSVIFEGATADGFETILTVVDPTTADRTITLPNVTGTVITTGDTGTVTNTMLAGSISDTKLSTISTAGKVANSATTATNANTASAIVARDASGNFSAGTITTTGNVVMNNASPTAYFQDTDNRSAMIHVNGNTFYILRGDGTNSLSWATVGGAWPLTINLENNNATFGGTVTAPTFSGALSGSATYSTYLWMTGYVGTYYMSGAWTGAHWQLTTNHGSPVRVGYADSAGSAGSASGSRFDGTAFRGAGAADADSWDVQGIQSGAGNAGAAVAIWATNVAPQFRVGANNPTVYLRNADDSAYNTLEGIITNVSSAHLKQDIETFPQVPHSVGAAVNEDEILTGLNIVRQLRPVTYKWKEKEYLSQLPENPRRALALSRLNTIRKSKGLEPYDSDELHHDCSRDNCSGTADNPCQWTENWNIGNIGFISQEVGAIIPQAAILGKEGEFTGLDSLAMTALAVAAIKELDAKVTSLMERIEALENK